MSRIQKLFDRVKNNPQQVRFDEICKLAGVFGFKYKGGKGSHRVYSQKGIVEILNFQNVHGMAKPYQVRQFLKIIEDNDLSMKEEE
ncbi:MAG: type II toxin-antitoxin system HicA family toxin [Nitrospirae bacterium]|nr:type II toxin-antitoxin system HicA family toxin [Nitrospirota bacterium]